MTPEEIEQLEEDYPQFNWGRMGRALFCCGVIFFLGYMFT